MLSIKHVLRNYSAFYTVEACAGDFVSIVDTIPEIPSMEKLGQISLTLISGLKVEQ